MIEDVIDQVIRKSQPSSGGDLSGFIQDADYGLVGAEEEVFESVELLRSSNPRSLINGRAVVRSTVQSLQEISQALARAWVFMAYPHFEASAVQWYRDETVLRFVTVIAGNLFFVTGTINATGPAYARLVENFDREFASLGGRIPSRPKTSDAG